MLHLKQAARGSALSLIAVLAAAGAATAQNPATTITIDANANRKAINPNIYGVAYYAYDTLTTTANLSGMNCPLVREGGNSASVYNWNLNADNRANDWYWVGYGDANTTAGGRVDDLMTTDNGAGAKTMVTIPMVGYVANLGANRTSLWSFSIAKYGAQTGHEPTLTDAGNGVKAAGGNVTGNNPLDAYVASTPATQQSWVNHLLTKWGNANSSTGVKYYIMDNEVMIWQGTHRDIHPVGTKMDEIYNDIVSYAGMVKTADPTALVAGPEEWGWTNYFQSGYDSQNPGGTDRAAHGGMDYYPWLLQQLKAYDTAHSKRLLDVLTVHAYPYLNEAFSNDESAAMQANRNKETRYYWDPTYTDPSWVNTVTQLIPRMHTWVNTYYPGTQLGITEYNWGDDNGINGATCQADILGIFGREALDMGTRWTTPAPTSMVYKAFQMYRNYDGAKSTFGDTSVSDTVANPDNLASFAAQRASDNALTVMVINKVTGTTPITINLSNFTAASPAKRYQLTSSGTITHLADLAFSGNSVVDTAASQSITLYIIPKGSGGTATFTGTATATPSRVAPGAVTSIVASFKDTGAALSNGIADIEVYNAGGTMVAQQYWTGQNWAANQTLQFTFNWTASATTGTYTVKLGVDSANWASNLFWNNGAATIIDAATDSAQYNFESGTQSWATSGAPITGVATSTTQKFAGSQSLAVTINGAASAAQALVNGPSTAAGKVVTFHVWVPSGSQITSIQPYVMDKNFAWTGTYKTIGTLTTNAWNTVTLTVPSNAVLPLFQMGVQFTTGATWSGTCYVDSVSW